MHAVTDMKREKYCIVLCSTEADLPHTETEAPSVSLRLLLICQTPEPEKDCHRYPF